jgi:general secretion pathway protein G
MFTTPKRSRRSAFSLVELVVVVLIVGILAAVVAPKMFDTAGEARDSATRASLAVVRDAIELYRSQNGSYPSAANIKTDLRNYYKGTFPKVQTSKVGTAKQNNDVAASTADPITVVTGNNGWAYNAATGEFVVNHTDCLAW